MARVGIYVGDKEIIRRYVGDKLVWEKFKVLATNSFGHWYQGSDNTASQSILNNESRGYDNQILGYVTAIKVGRNILYPDSVAIYVSRSSSSSSYLDAYRYEKITFKNEYDKNLFMSLVQKGETVYYGTKGNRR